MNLDLETIRRINNIVQIGTVVETKISEGKALARVNILGRVTDFLPVKMIGNDFVKIWIPVKVNEQVLVFCPYGNANSGFIIPSIFNKDCKEPEGADDKNVIVKIANVFLKSDGENITIEAKNFKLDKNGNLTVTGRITDILGNLTDAVPRG